MDITTIVVPHAARSKVLSLAHNTRSRRTFWSRVDPSNDTATDGLAGVGKGRGGTVQVLSDLPEGVPSGGGQSFPLLLANLQPTFLKDGYGCIWPIAKNEGRKQVYPGNNGLPYQVARSLPPQKLNS